MGYYVDLTKITIDEYMVNLETCYLPPSREVLRDNIKERFDYFKSIGINNVDELKKHLTKKENIIKLSKLKQFDDEYPKLLLRELKSLLPTPNKIDKFSCLPKELSEKLKKLKITNTFKLYDFIKTRKKRNEFAKANNISKNEILALAKLTDLSRIRWVGEKFACMLLESGYDTVFKCSEVSPDDLLEQINKVNIDEKYYKGKIGLKDIKVFIDESKKVELEIEY